MSFKAQDLLFSESSFKFPLFGEDQGRGSCSPSIGVNYLPMSDKVALDNLAFDHEWLHQRLSQLPSLCLEKVLSFLLYHEFTRERFSSSAKLSALAPKNDQTIKMLKTIFDEVHRQNAAVQEAFTLQRDYHEGKRDLEEAGVDLTEWFKIMLRNCSGEFSVAGLKDLYRMFIRSDFMWEVRKIIRRFAFVPPLPPLNLPSTPDGKLDQAKIDSDTAEQIVDRFQESYRMLPHSPWLRLINLVLLAKRMEKSSTDFDQESYSNYLERIKSREALNTEAIRVEKDSTHYHWRKPLSPKGSSECIYIDTVCQKSFMPRFCPLDLIQKLGLEIDFGFGEPINDNSKEQSVSCTPIQHVRWLDIYTGRPFYHGCPPLHDEPQTIFTTKRPIAGSPINWPRRSFLIASEALRKIVFDHPELEGKYSRLLLTEYLFGSPGELIRPTEQFDQGKITSRVRSQPKLSDIGPQGWGPLIEIRLD